jgi:hypothetical protein
MTERPYVSPSQLDMFCRCGEQYRRRYLEKEIIPPGIAALKGTGFHRGAETNMRQKLESHVDLPPSQIVEAAVAGFEAQLAGGVQLSDEEVAVGMRKVVADAKDDVAEMALVHAQDQAPDYQPVLVEERVTIALPGPRDLLGIIDLVDSHHRVVDFKTSGKKKAQSEVDNSVQLTVYAAAYQRLTGHIPSEVRLDTVVRTKTRCDRQVLSSQRTGADFNALANRINVIVQAIEAGSFTPAAPGSWCCSPKWCGYWSECPFVNSERRDAAERSGE